MKYTVVKGDTIRIIAERKLGDEMKWRVLWNMNRNTLKSGNPDLIYPGEVLEIPEKNPPKVETVENNDEVTLYVNDKVFQGWTSVRVRRAISAISGSFSLGLVEKWNETTAPWPIFAGDKAVLTIGNDTVITGYIDDVSISIAGSEHSISAEGRDKTADLVDCSATNRPGQWKNIKFEALAKKLCEGFGVEVLCNISTGGVIPAVNIQPGETVFEILDRIAKQKKLLMGASGDGKLTIGRSGSTPYGVTLKEGENIKTCSATFSSKERFSKYLVEGQESSSGVIGTAQDSAVTRFRPLTIVAEEKADKTYCVNRAQWESRVRAAKAQTVSIQVQGWRLPSGELWEINKLVNVDCPSVRVSGELLISEVEYSKDSSGTVTNLTLCRKDAYLDEVALPAGNDPVGGK